MQVGVACSSCQRKAPPEDMFRCETCRADIDNDRDVILCGVCATKHSMAFKEHKLDEDRMASKRDIEEAIKRIDRKQPANRTYVIAAQSEATEYYAMEANEAALKCLAKSKEIRASLGAMNNLTKDGLELMTSKALRLKEITMETHAAVRRALSVCDDAIIAEIGKCNRVLQESNDVHADKANGPTTADPMPSTSAASAAPSSSAASRVARKRRMVPEEIGSLNERPGLH